MKKTDIHRIVYEELKQYLESCGYTHTTKGKKLKSPGGTGEKELKKEVNPISTGIKYMNKFQKGSEVGTIKAHDEDPSDNEPKQESTMKLKDLIKESDNTQYSWGQINKALMSYGMSPAKILRVLSVLKQQTKNR
jgi:hypothetical protein